MSNIQIIYEIFFCIKFEFLNKFSRVPRKNLLSFQQFCCTGATRRPRKFDLRQIPESQTEASSPFSETGGKSGIPRRHEGSRKLGWMVEGFARNPTGMRFSRYSPGNLLLSSVLFEARDIGLGNRYMCLFSSLLFFSDSITSSPPWFHFRRTVAPPPLCFPDCFPDGILFRKNTRRILRIYRHSVSPSGYPFIVPSPAVIAISASAAKRTTSLRGHPLSPVYVIFFPRSQLAVLLFGAWISGNWLVRLSFHEIRSERLRQHLYLLSRFSISFSKCWRATGS